MKSLTKKNAKSKERKTEGERGKTSPDGRKQAQCCAKISKNVAGCHD
jgi:hypothetical protein